VEEQRSNGQVDVDEKTMHANGKLPELRALNEGNG